MYGRKRGKLRFGGDAAAAGGKVIELWSDCVLWRIFYVLFESLDEQRGKCVLSKVPDELWALFIDALPDFIQETKSVRGDV